MRTFATEKCFYLLKSADLGSHFWFVRINYVTLQRKVVLNVKTWHVRKKSLSLQRSSL